MQGFNRQYSGGGRQTFGGGGGGYGGAYDNRGSPMGGGGPMRGPSGGYPDGRSGNMGNWDSGMGSYGPGNYGRNMGQQGRNNDLRQSLNTMRDPGGRDNLALGILDAVKSLGVLGGGYGPQGGRQGPPQAGYGGRQDQMRPNMQNNRTLVQLTQSGGQMPPGTNQQNFNRGPQQNWNKSPNFANRNGPKGNMVKRLGNNPGNKNKIQQNKKNKATVVKTLTKAVKKASPKKEGETVENDKSETETETVEENGASEATDSSENDKKNDDTPKDALKCHMCNMDNFASVTAYLNHLESQNHQQMTELFHAKGRITLQLLQANAALASQRIMNKSRKVGVKGRILDCFKCQCPIPFTLAKHINTPEHQQVVNFMTEKCCGRSYNNREDLEEHRLSLVHLRRQMACEARKDEKDDKDQEQIEALGMTDLSTEEQQAALNGKVQDDVQAAHIEVSPHYTPDTIPPYDPDSALGKSFILTKNQYHCRCCRQLFQSGKNAIENHCRSSNHYEHFVSYIKQQAEQKQEKVESSSLNNDTGKSKAVCEDENVETSKTNSEEENDDNNDDEKEQKEEEDDLELEDLDAMETIDIPLDGDKDDDEEEEEEDQDQCEDEDKMEDELLVNEEIELQEDIEENGEAEGADNLAEDKMTSGEIETVNEAEAEEAVDYGYDDDDMGVNSPVAYEEEDDDDDDDDDEEDDDEEINPKRRARGPAKSTPAKRALGAAPVRRGGRNSS